jgi:hypothetical protein
MPDVMRAPTALWGLFLLAASASRGLASPAPAPATMVRGYCLIPVQRAQKTQNVINNCDNTIWPVIFSGVEPGPNQGWEAAPGSTKSFDLGSAWGGSICKLCSCLVVPAAQPHLMNRGTARLLFRFQWLFHLRDRWLRSVSYYSNIKRSSSLPFVDGALNCSSKFDPSMVDATMTGFALTNPNAPGTSMFQVTMCVLCHHAIHEHHTELYSARAYNLPINV